MMIEMTSKENTGFGESATINQFHNRENFQNSSVRRLNSSILPLQIEDDDSERSRRRSLHMQKRLSLAHNTSITETSSTVHSNESEVKNHFDVCLKLFTENKINLKNAWNLKIIDYMRSVIKSNRDGKVLQVGSISLDVGTKVYSIRVDDVHSEGLKLASNMARMDNEENNSLIDEGTKEGEKEEGVARKEAAKKRKRQRRKSETKHTIGKDIKSNLVDLATAETASFQTRTNCDWSSVDNFFTTKLPMNPSSTKFMFLSKLPSWISYDCLDNTVTNQKTYPFEIEDHPEKIEICREFSKFDIENWDPTLDDVEETQSLINQSLLFDDKGIPMPELDGTIHDIFKDEPQPDGYNSSEEEECVEEMGLMRGDAINILNLAPIEDDNIADNEYLYQNLENNDKYLSHIWAGPSHWKLKYLKRSVPKFSGTKQNETKVRQKRRKVHDEPVDFSKIIECEDENANKVVDSGYSTQVDPSKITLPRCFNIKAPFPLMTKPKVFINHMTNEEVSDIERGDVAKDGFEAEPTNFNNPDEDEYCSQNAVDNEADEYFSGKDPNLIEQEQLVGQGNFLGSNLVDQPELVPETRINYATQAKKMDMKKLKKKIWEIIQDENNKVDGTHVTNFVDIYKILPKYISAKMNKDLSCSLALLGVLHLANEFQFKITSISQTNFTIEKI